MLSHGILIFLCVCVVPKGGVNVTIGVRLYTMRCANFLVMPEMKDEVRIVCVCVCV